MTRAADSVEVQGFLDALLMGDADKHDIVQQVREVLFTIGPEAEEELKYGGILFSYNGSMHGGVFAYTHHVSVEFGQGARMDDPDGLLEGNGKFRRHLKLRSLQDIQDKNLSYFMKQTFA